MICWATSETRIDIQPCSCRAGAGGSMLGAA